MSVTGVRFPHGPCFVIALVEQCVARHSVNVEVAGSIPVEGVEGPVGAGTPGRL